MERHRTRIKICGLTREQDIKTANQLLPDYIGFVFFEKSIRYLTPAHAADLKKQLDPRIRAVGVFLDNDISLVKELAASGTIALIQLHGSSMGEDFMKRLRDFTELPIIRAFRVESEADVQQAAQSSADYVLLDSGNGGTGKSFDWNCVQGMERPWFLAGGLACDNVTDAIHKLHPWAVDVSSGLETNGRKDPDKMKRFVESVRSTTLESGIRI